MKCAVSLDGDELLVVSVYYYSLFPLNMTDFIDILFEYALYRTCALLVHDTIGRNSGYVAI